MKKSSKLVSLRVISQVALALCCASCQSLTESGSTDRAFEARKRAIAAALRQVPPPAVPAEAQQHFDQAALILGNSTDAVSRQKAIAEFEACLNIAPWKADAYFNVARLKELDNDLDGAIQNYQLYLLANPDADDARSVQNTIGELERKKPKTGVAAFEGLWRGTYAQIDGEPRRKWNVDQFGVVNEKTKHHYMAKAAGKKLVLTFVWDVDFCEYLAGDTQLFATFSGDGRRLNGESVSPAIQAMTAILSEDGNEMRIRIKQIGGNSRIEWVTWWLERFDQ